MVTVDAAVPFLPDFLPALLYGRKPLAAFGSVIEEYEIYENFLRWQAFASQQIPEKSFVRMCYVHILWHLEIFDSVHSCHKFIC